MYPVVTPPDWRYQWRKKRWLLEVRVKSLWSEARSRQQHAGLALFMTNTLDKLAREGWALDAALHGVLFLSRPQGDRLDIRRTRSVTAALAFGVLPEIRTVPRAPPGERFAQVRCMAGMHVPWWCARRNVCARVEYDETARRPVPTSQRRRREHASCLRRLCRLRMCISGQHLYDSGYL